MGRATYAVVVLLVGLAVVSARQIGPAIPDVVTTNFILEDPLVGFGVWALKYGKSYSSQERAKRFETFETNVRVISEHNAKDGSTFSMAVNEFTDLTFAEFSQRLLLSTAPERRNASTPFMHGAVEELPSSVNWVKRGAVTPVKNQLSCGSCWAFSSTGAIEGINYIKSGKLVALSEQQLVDCATEKNNGCGGGLMDYAFEYVMKNGGLDSEDSYGYWAFDLPCQSRKESDRHVVAIDGFEDVPANDAQALKKALSQQPVSVAICVNEKLQFYSSGVFDEASGCVALNHGVLAVGYSDEGEHPYWLVKNSWGEAWGEAGYFRLASKASDPKGTSGILQVTSYPIKNSDKNPEVSEICGYFGWSECGPKYSCSCDLNLFGLACLSWGCVSKNEPGVSVANI